MWRTGLVALRHVVSSRTRARTHVPCIGRRILNHCATREALCHTFVTAYSKHFSLHQLFLLTRQSDLRISLAPELWEVNVAAEGELGDSGHPAYHPQAPFLPPRHPSRLPKALILRPSTGVTETGQEERKLLQQSPTCAALVMQGRIMGTCVGAGWKRESVQLMILLYISETEVVSKIPRTSPLR